MRGCCRITELHLCLIADASPDSAAKGATKDAINPDTLLYTQGKLWPNVLV